MVPSRVEKRKEALAPLERRNPVVPFWTVPVGVPWPVPEAGGIIALNAITPAIEVTKFVPLPLALIHSVLPPDTPQGFVNPGSVTGAGTKPSDMMFVTANEPAVCAVARPHDAAAANSKPLIHSVADLSCRKRTLSSRVREIGRAHV